MTGNRTMILLFRRTGIYGLRLFFSTTDRQTERDRSRESASHPFNSAIYSGGAPKLTFQNQLDHPAEMRPRTIKNNVVFDYC